MRKESASILALAVLGLAEELKPNDVPLACANICGPIVELSSICDIDGTTTQVQELKRRKLSHLPRALGLTKAPAGRKKPNTNAKDKRQVLPDATSSRPTTRSIGQFKTIPIPTSVPAATPPTTPPVADPVKPNLDEGDAAGNAAGDDAAAAAPINLRPTTTPTFINPLFPSLLPPQTPPQAQVPPSTPTTPSPPSSSASPTGTAGEAGDDGANDVNDDVGSIRDDAGALWPGQKQKQDEENRERVCFCTNESFELARVAGLCSSCIAQIGDDRTPMKAIMSMCNFTTEEYDPTKDAIAVNAKVKATKPTVSGQPSGAQGRARPAAELLAIGIVLGLVGLAEAAF